MLLIYKVMATYTTLMYKLYFKCVYLHMFLIKVKEDHWHIVAAVQPNILHFANHPAHHFKWASSNHPSLQESQRRHSQHVAVLLSAFAQGRLYSCWGIFHCAWLKTVPSLLLLIFFFPFVFLLLTDICYHAKQVLLCKRMCHVCVSPSSLLRTQMSSVIKNPVNFWKETDSCPPGT